tara:strand:- start:37 stop:456 length:420 start_codon:yes stop_codon:yes gene_type:complete
MNNTVASGELNPLYYWSVLPQIGISVIGWFSTILSLNRFRFKVREYSSPEKIALVLYIIASFTRVVAGGATVRKNFAMQLLSGILGSLLTFTAFIMIYNNNIDLPSKQQLQSIFLVIITTGLWEIHSRIFMTINEQESQ